MRELKHIFLTILSASVLVACVKEKEDTPLNGVVNTPLDAYALLDCTDTPAAPGTKATASDFENGDVLIAYLRHVTWDGADGARTSVATDKAPLLAQFTKGSSAMSAYSGSDVTPIGTGTPLGLSSSTTRQTADLVASPALYWDDFSTGAKGDATDIRTDGHYLQSYYGYCYNGGTPTTDLTVATGVLGWTVLADQTTESSLKNSDLLWSAEQTPVDYKHAVAERKGLVLPYTHAMSKVTLEIVLEDGFDVDANGKALAFGSNNTTPTLYANRVTTTTAPTLTHSTTVASGDDAKIQMYLSDNELTVNKVRVYEAIIAPTAMVDGKLLAQVTVDGNNYDIYLTTAILTTVPDGATAAWNSKLGVDDFTLPGVNYRLKVTLKKQKIDVTAFISDWTDVNAAVDGEIVFDADVTSSDVTGVTEITAGSFDLWRSETNDDYTTKASTYTFTAGEWVGDPTLYWKNGSTPYYFRALATTTDGVTIASVDGNKTAEQGTDLLWGTTSKHTGYDEGVAINPRTGDVPLTFSHALSKMTVELVTTDGADQVVLAGSSVKIINLYTGGTIDVADGTIGTMTPSSGSTEFEQTVDAQMKVKDKLFIPQSLSEFESGAARDVMAEYYTASELAKIYSDGTSKGTGAYTYYLISDLVYVPAVLYTEDSANEYNATLPGAKLEGYKDYYTFEEWITLPGHSNHTQTEYDNASDEDKTKHTWTADEANAYNALLPGAVSAGDEKEESYYKLGAGDPPVSHNPGEIKDPGNKIVLFITLADGTLYTVMPSAITDGGVWEAGKHYIYKITLAKDQISFRVYIKDWEEVESSGTITPEW